MSSTTETLPITPIPTPTSTPEPSPTPTDAITTVGPRPTATPTVSKSASPLVTAYADPSVISKRYQPRTRNSGLIYYDTHRSSGTYNTEFSLACGVGSVTISAVQYTVDEKGEGTLSSQLQPKKYPELYDLFCVSAQQIRSGVQNNPGAYSGNLLQLLPKS